MKKMKLHTTIALVAAISAPTFAGETMAIRVGRAETVTKGVIEHAVILVEDGKIVVVGEDLPVERGIPVLDRPEWTVVPGFVNCYSRLGCDSEGGDDNSPDVMTSDELWPKAAAYKEVVTYGVTTLGLYPAGNGISGQAVAVRPLGANLPTDRCLEWRDSPGQPRGRGPGACRQAGTFPGESARGQARALPII